MFLYNPLSTSSGRQPLPREGGVRAAALDELNRQHSAAASTVAWIGVCALILLAPFEKTRPLIQMPGQSISSVEAVLLMVFSAWTISMALGGVARPWHILAGWRTNLTLPWTALLAVMLLSAWTVPENRVNALHMVGRGALAFGVYVLTVNASTSPRRIEVVFVTAAVTGVLVAALALLEYAGVTPVVQALSDFRPAVFLFGAQVRATGPFLYPTVASMYLEILFAFVSVLFLVAVDAGRRKTALVVVLALVALGQAIVLTFTRSGLITVASSLAIIGILRHRCRGFDAGVRILAAVALVIAAQFVASYPFEVLRLRLTTEGASGYAAAFAAPRELAMSTGSTANVPLTVTNTGQTTWAPDGARPFRLSYHWLLAADDRVVTPWEGGMRTLFPRPVLPGESVALVAQVRAPSQPGQYRLLWDIEEDRRRWFSREPGATLFVSQTSVSGAATAAAPEQFSPVPGQSERPGRLLLWRAAAGMIADHPIRGVGPDNFRLLYGPYINLRRADPRLNSHNMYIEILVGGGVLAGVALAWLLWRVARSFVALWRQAATPLATLSAGVLAAGVAVAIHGLVDSFLGFTATYVLIAITLGLVSACETLGAVHDSSRSRAGGDGSTTL